MRRFLGGVIKNQKKNGLLKIKEALIFYDR